MREQYIQRQIIKHLERDHNAYVVKVITANKRGVPDILACVAGRFIAIEVKRPGQKPTALQGLTLARINDLGGYAITADSVESAKNQLSSLLIS